MKRQAGPPDERGVLTGPACCCRAHGEWLEASYGFKRFDPRKPAQLRLNLEALSVLHRGASCGTAIAGRHAVGRPAPGLPAA